MRMSAIIADVIQDVRDDLDPARQPNPARLIRLFNELQAQIALNCECLETNIEKVVSGYAIESGLLAIVGTTSRSVVVASDNTDPYTDGDVQSRVADHYRGWILTNNTRLGSAIVTDSADSTGTTTLRLSKAITGMVLTDEFMLERQVRFVDLPWYLIRPKVGKGVQWDTTWLEPASIQEIKELHNRNIGATGTPLRYAIEQASGMKQRMWLYPQPTADGILKIFGVRRPADCFFTVTTTAGNAAGDTLISTNIPAQALDYYTGSEVLLKSGSYTGEIRTVSDYNPKVSAGVSPLFYFEDSFSDQVATAVSFELLSGLPDDCASVIQDFLKWRIYEREAGLAPMANRYRLSYENGMDAIKAILQRRNTANISGPGYGLRAGRGWRMA